MIGLSFKKQSARYLARKLYRRNKNIVNYVLDNAKQVGFDRKVENYVLVPVYVSETCLPNFIAAVGTALNKTKANVLFFVNGNAEQISRDQFEFQLAQRRTEVLKGFENIDAKVQVVSRYFPRKSTIGQIRGMMCDLVILFAMMNGQVHPRIVFNDVDTLRVSPLYYQKLFKGLADPDVKMLVGPVYYGYKNAMLHGYPEDTHIPELYIYNELNQSILNCARTGEINYEKRILSEGPSMAFSAAAYCAVDGFDWSKACGEDDDFNFSLHKYNPNVFANGIRDWKDTLDDDHRLSIRYDRSIWLISDPRRILSMINKGKTGIEAWMDNAFVETMGASLTKEELTSAYKDYADRMHFQDIQKANQSDDKALQQKILEKILYIALWICQVEQRIRNQDQARSVLFRAGIIPDRQCQIGLKPLLQAIKWRSCRMVNQLVALG